MRMTSQAVAFGIWGALALAGGGSPARAQMTPEEEQRCVWSCLANSPGAESRAYQQCVERLCLGPQTPQPQAAARRPGVAAPTAAWRASPVEGWTHYAGVQLPGDRSFSFLCQRGGLAVLAVGGLGAQPNGVELQIDDQSYGLRFVADKGMLYTPSTPHLQRALMGGSSVQVATQGGSARFPLAGSGAAIRAAMAACGLPG